MNTPGKPFLYIALLTLYLFSIAIQSYAEYVPGEILVKFRTAADSSEANNLNINIASAKKREFRRINIHHIKLPGNMSVEEAIEYYEQDPNVEYAEPNYIVYATAPQTPNDTFLNELWGLHNTGQLVNGTSGSSDDDIDAPEAWDNVTGTTGSSAVIIAVVDSGIAYNHPDLNANVWTNTGETNCSDSIDNDNNGYIDDCIGWDFADNNNDPMDYNGHGTHVSGTIAAVGNNNTGTTGVMWQAQLMPLRFLGADGSGTTADAVEAILYANDNGAHVINNSWGGSGFSQTLKDAIDASSAVVVCAAGNDGTNNESFPFYPASFTSDNILSVAATNQSDSIASFSNFGLTSVDLAAPGVNIYSAVPAKELEDTFDDGNITTPAWTTGGTLDTWAASNESSYSGNYSLADSHNVNYGNNTNAWARTPVIDLSANDGCMLTYRLKLDTLSGDVLYIEASVDDTSWTTLPNAYSGTTGGDFNKFIEDLTGYDGEATVYVRYRLQTNSSGTDEGVYIDDVEIICTTNATEEYEYFQGTSMASPHVAGVAGLILAKDPSLLSNQVKAAILNNVNSIVLVPPEELLTNGRLNAFNALQDTSVSSIPTNLSVSAVSTTQVNLSWTDNSSTETGYKIERKEEADGTFAEIASVGQNITSYSDTSVSQGTTYYYRTLIFGGSYGIFSYSNDASAAVPAVSSAGGGGGGGGGCFIDTSDYSNVLLPYIEKLQNFTRQITF